MRLQRNVWFAVVGIPAEIRHFFGGKTTLVQTTGTGDYRKARDRADIIIGGWRQEIAHARAGLTMTRDQKLLRLAQNYRQAEEKGDMDTALGLLLRDLSLMTGVPAERLSAMLKKKQGDVDMVLGGLPTSVTIWDRVRRITVGRNRPRHDRHHRLRPWSSRLAKPSLRPMAYHSNMTRFASGGWQ
jgi:hypothetical protein